jgi:hypothetical protein
LVALSRVGREHAGLVRGLTGDHTHGVTVDARTVIKLRPKRPQLEQPAAIDDA